MIIKKFRVKNYKSIIDSDDCYLSNDNITILAGKNESGKTTLLEALEDFDSQTNIREEAIPIFSSDDDPKIPCIEVTFEVPAEDIKEIFDTIGLQLKKKPTTTITLTKVFPDNYILHEDSIENLGLLKEKDTSSLEQSIRDQYQILIKYISDYPALNGNLEELNFDDFKKLSINAKKFDEETIPNISNIPEVSDQENFTAIKKKYSDLISELISQESQVSKFVNELKAYIPNFILFSSFDDVFPNKVPTNELDSNKWVSDLQEISDLNVGKFKQPNKQVRLKHKNDINIEVNQDYKKFWTQDDVAIQIEYDNEDLSFWIHENEYLYRPDQRSKGQQWYMSFYFKVSARASEDVPNIILIDEPGLYLHAKAQKDILSKFEDIAKKGVQLIFSTHSSYLLENNNFHRIRLIQKDKKLGTKVFNKVHALADKETVTPLLTAIGLELTSSIENTDKSNNVVVEGPSDIFYFQALAILLNDMNNLNFVFGGGAGNMPFVGTILHGWGCKVLYLYDNDQGYKDGKLNLENNWNIQEGVMSISGNVGSIEDLFSTEDFKKLVLEDESLNFSSKVSEYLKRSKKDKVLISKLFLEKVKKDESKVALSEESIGNFKELFKKLNEFFK